MYIHIPLHMCIYIYFVHTYTKSWTEIQDRNLVPQELDPLRIEKIEDPATSAMKGPKP